MTGQPARFDPGRAIAVAEDHGVPTMASRSESVMPRSASLTDSRVTSPSMPSITWRKYVAAR